MKLMSSAGLEELKEMIIQKLNEIMKYEDYIYACDLHHEIFNTDYFIIGYAKAEEWLKEHYDIFDAIGKIKEYEESNFGQVTTDLSNSESVVNMLVYIIGEEILMESDTLNTVWNSHLDKESCNEIIEEIRMV